MEKIIKQGKLEDGIYYLPDIQLGRKQYLDIAKHIEFLGGKWNRSRKGFVFDRNIDNISKLLGDNTKLKKEIQLFETPEDIADKLCEYAEIDNHQTILEPSAGRGRIIKSIQKVCSCQIDYCEINETNREYLSELENINLIGEDFLELKTEKKYSRIIANPPFSKNQDIAHIKKMFSLLDKNGILVSISSRHWEIAKGKKETEFREFLESVGAKIIKLDSGEFKGSGTNVCSNIIIINN
jgi:hypothetical protein